MRIPYVVFAAVLLAGSAVAQLRHDTISQPWASNNGGGIGGAVYFDLAVASGVIITQFDCNFTLAAGTTGSIDVYTIGGTYVGNEGNQAAWTLAGSATCTAAGRDLPTACVLAAPIVLNPGMYGVAICCTNLAHAYTNGVGTNQSFSDPFLTSTHGAALNTCFGAGTPFSPRVWNGSIHYFAGQMPGFAADVTSGPAPLTVNFTDQSFTSDPAGITAWLWDVDSDGSIDYTTRNCTHTYTQPGTYDVSLQIVGAQFGISPPLVRTAFINAGPMVGSYVFHRPGCAGSVGTVTNNVAFASSTPRINSTFSVTLWPLPASDIAIMAFGVGDSTWNGQPLPLGGGPFGAPGCALNITPESTRLVVGTGGVGVWNQPIPDLVNLIGTRFFTQALVLDPGINRLGGVVSDSAMGVVGQ